MLSGPVALIAVQPDEVLREAAADRERARGRLLLTLFTLPRTASRRLLSRLGAAPLATWRRCNGPPAVLSRQHARSFGSRSPGEVSKWAI